MASPFDLTLNLTETPDALPGQIVYNTALFDSTTIARMVRHFGVLLESLTANPDQRLADVRLLTQAEQQQLLGDWNATQADYPQDQSIHQCFEAQVARTPAAIAVVFADQQLSYAELDARANQLAHHLSAMGVAAEVPVGLCLERSLQLLVGLLGILKAGGAYVPLDPRYPQERLTFMLRDARIPVLVTQQRLAAVLEQHQVHTVCLDVDAPVIALRPTQNPHSPVTGENLAYVIYTSGSTGRPKGVTISHRNVANFFTGLDMRLGSAPPGTWLAVTNVAFDISVVELLWTLARGFRVVVQDELAEHLHASQPGSDVRSKPIDFSLFYFVSDNGSSGGDIYRLLLEGAKYADAHGFAAIWTPERHFHAFGGLYPNPSVTSAAVAAVTQRVQIRAGSVVLPLHNPIRVAEEWAVVDNLSHGRVGVSFASGWHADDFVFAPEQYRNRKDVMLRQIEVVRELWRGQSQTFQGGAGNAVAISILPRLIQPELPIWLTAAGNPETFRSAGEIG